MIPNYDHEIEKRGHPENFEDAEKITVLGEKGKKLLEIGKVGRGKFKYGIKRYGGNTRGLTEIT